jgi:hypothetical protein
MDSNKSFQRSIVQHLREQPFITATGFAALVHSTWSLGTFFSGEQPAITADVFQNGHLWLVQLSQWLLWCIPAFAIAFSLDVGQIVTSAEIRSGQRSYAKYGTFAIFAIATYYLQWLYMAHHMPYMALGAGVHSAMQGVVYAGRDLAVFVIPLLLPLSTLLYTFSHGDTVHNAPPIEPLPMQVKTPVFVEKSEPLKLQTVAPVAALPDITEMDTEEVKPVMPRSVPLGNSTNEAVLALQNARRDGDQVTIQCPHCAWQTTKDNDKSARLALTGHLKKCNAR